MDRANTPEPHERAAESESQADREREHAPDRDRNAPRTTEHGVTAPKFGSAGSGGAELEPGPERD